jgi:hypothetical protein
MNNKMRIEKKVDAIPALINALPAKFEALLEEKQMNGPISMAQMRTLVETSPAMIRMEQRMDRTAARLEEYLNIAENRAPVGRNNSSGSASTVYEEFLHPNGLRRRIPPDWDWPNLLMRHAYVYWHCGDPAKRIAPMKRLEKKDFTGKLQKRGVRTLGELRPLMGKIDSAAKTKGVQVKKVMTQAEANTFFLWM